jgi:hypothetical protein
LRKKSGILPKEIREEGKLPSLDLTHEENYWWGPVSQPKVYLWIRFGPYEGIGTVKGYYQQVKLY